MTDNKDDYIAELKAEIESLKAHVSEVGSEMILYMCMLDNRKKAHDKIIKRFSSMLHKTRLKTIKPNIYDYDIICDKVAQQKKQINTLYKSIAIILNTIKAKTETITELGIKLKKEKQAADKWHKDFLNLETKGIKKFIITKIFGVIK